MKKKRLNDFKLMPIGKDGKDVDWFYGWKGIEKLTKALGKTWIDVGELIEDNWVDRTSFDQIMLCQAVHKSLNKKHNKPKLKLAPKGTESNMHYAIQWIKKIFLNYIQKLQENQKMKAKLIKQYHRCIKSLCSMKELGSCLSTYQLMSIQLYGKW